MSDFKNKKRLTAFLLPALLTAGFMAFLPAAQVYAEGLNQTTAVLAAGTVNVTAAVTEVAAEASEAQLASEAYIAAAAGNSGRLNLDAKGFKIQAQIGLQGNIRSGAAMPLQFTMTSAEDFEGIIRVIVAGTDYVAYEAPLNLVAGNEKTISMAASAYDQPYMYLQLESSDGRILLEEALNYNCSNTETPLMGILSSDYTALNYFDRCNVTSNNYSGVVSILEMNEKNLPDNAKALECMNYLLITGYDTSRLSKAQQEAILQWVDEGGVLILGTGPDYKQTLSMFKEEELNLIFRGYGEGSLDMPGNDGGDPLTYTAQDGIWKLEGGDSMTAADILDDGANPLVWYQESGEGVIAVCAFNPAMQPFSGWKESRLLADRLVSSVTTPAASVHLAQVLYGGDEDFDYSTRTLLSRLFPAKELPDGLLYMLLLAFVICGPVSYGVLRKQDKTQYLWILYPVEALVFTVLILLSTLGVRIQNPLAASMVVFEQENGITKEKVSTSILTPASKWYHVDFAPGLRNMETERSWYYRPDNDTKVTYNIAMREDAEGSHLRLNRNTPFETINLKFTGSSNLNLDDYLVTSYTKSLKGVGGSVTNTSPYTMLGVTVFDGSSSVISLGTIEPGQTLTFGENENESMDMGYMSIGDRIDTSTEEGEIAALTMQSIQDRYNMYYGYSNVDEGECMTYAYLSCWDKPVITTDKIRERNVAVVVRKETLTYSDYHSAFDIKIRNYTMPDSDSFDPNDGQMYHLEAYGNTNLTGVADKIYVLSRAADYAARYGETSQTHIFAFNYETEAYDLLFADSERMEFADGKCPYIKDGIIRWKFTCVHEYDDYIPELTAIGGQE